MNWVNILNTLSCLALLYVLLAVGSRANKWTHKLGLAPLSLMVGIQVIDPLVGWIPDLAWPSVALIVSMLFAMLMLNKELMAMVKAL